MIPAPRAPSRATGRSSLRVAVANVHGGVRADGSPFDVPEALGLLDADVLVVPETFWPEDDESPVDRFARLNGYGTFAYSAWMRSLTTLAPRAPDVSGQWGVALLSRVPVLSSRRIDLGATPGHPEERKAAVVVSVSLAGREVQVVGVHLSHRIPFWPSRQLARLVRALPPGPTVIAGDFNLWGPLALSVLHATRPTSRWRRAVRGRTWPAQYPLAQIDHVMVRDLVARPGVVVEATGSDHHMVAAEITAR